MIARSGRDSLGTRIAGGAVAGACCGIAFGVLEVIWLDAREEVVATGRLMLWAGAAAAVVFSVVGALVETASGCLASPSVLAKASAASRSGRAGARPIGARAAFACFVLGALTIGRWRYYLDESLAPGEAPESKLLVVILLLASGALLGGIAHQLAGRLGPTRFALAWMSASIVIAAAYLLPHGGHPPTRARTPAVRPAAPTMRGSGSAPAHPHVFLIVADSLRADALGGPLRSAAPERDETSGSLAVAPASVHEFARTPQLDRLARDGIVFDAFCAQSAWTKPGFASILTGLPPRQHRAVRRTTRLPASVTTLAEVFQARGYATFGHSNANPNYSAAAGFDQGFEEFTDLAPTDRRLLAPPGAPQLALYQQVVEPVAARLVGYETAQFYVPADEYSERIIAGLQASKQPPARPLFAVLHYMDPHYPYFAGAKRGRPILLGSEAHLAGGAALANSLRQAYLGDVEFLDRHLGRLFEALRALGLYDDAIIVFTSDHGEEFFEHADWGHGRSLYREVTHVPLIIKLPASLGAGTRIAALASQTDLAPTLLALADLAIPDPMVGDALLAADGSPSRRVGGECLSTLDTVANEIESLRTPAATYIRALRTHQRRVAPVELYDRITDPAETTNLAERGDPRVAALEARLEAERARERQPDDPDDEIQLAPDVEARLRALGYVDDE